jgi:hypothetical protein
MASPGALSGVEPDDRFVHSKNHPYDVFLLQAFLALVK